MRVLRVARTPLSFPQRQPCADSVFNQSPLCSCLQLQGLAYYVWGREGVLGRETGLNWAFRVDMAHFFLFWEVIKLQTLCFLRGSFLRTGSILVSLEISES